MNMRAVGRFGLCIVFCSVLAVRAASSATFSVNPGADAFVAAGPSGATTTSGVGASDVLSYGRTSGLFAGVSLGGATLEPDNKGNKNLYGRAITASEIVLANAVQTPAAGQPFISLLNSKVAEHSK